MLETTDGRRFEKKFDVGVPAEDLAQQGDRLRAKFASLVAPSLGDATSAALAADLDRVDGFNDAGAVLSRLGGWLAKSNAMH